MTEVFTATSAPIEGAQRPEGKCFSCRGTKRIWLTRGHDEPRWVPCDCTPLLARPTWSDVFARIAVVREAILNTFGTRLSVRVYGVPRGGMIVAGFLCNVPNLCMCCDPTIASLIVDDIVDAGERRDGSRRRYPTIPFYSLFDKTGADAHLGKIVMPWEPNKVQEDDTRHIEAVSKMVSYLEACGTLQQPVAHLLRTSVGVLKEFVAHNPMV